jgi:hypothetical protein
LRGQEQLGQLERKWAEPESQAWWWWWGWGLNNLHPVPSPWPSSRPSALLEGWVRRVRAAVCGRGVLAWTLDLPNKHESSIYYVPSSALGAGFSGVTVTKSLASWS